MSEKTNKTKRKWRMPSAFAIIFGITAFMAALTWIVPSGAYDLNEDETPKAGTYRQVDKVRTEKDEKTGEEKNTTKGDE